MRHGQLTRAGAFSLGPSTRHRAAVSIATRILKRIGAAIPSHAYVTSISKPQFITSSDDIPRLTTSRRVWLASIRKAYPYVD